MLVDPNAPTEENEPVREPAPKRRYSRSMKIVLVVAIAIGLVAGWMIAVAAVDLFRLPR